MNVYTIESIRLSHSVDKHCFSVTEKNTNKTIVYITCKAKTKKLIEKADKIFRLKGDEHIKALKDFLESEFNLVIKLVGA